MSSPKKDTNVEQTIDVSGDIIRKQQEEALQKKIETRRKAMIELIMRQTDYTEEIARIKLEQWKNDYLKVIKEYMNPNFQDKKEEQPQSTTKNQMIYGEIRNFMDDVNRQQLWRKRRAEHLERQRAAYLAHMEKLQKENN